MLANEGLYVLVGLRTELVLGWERAVDDQSRIVAAFDEIAGEQAGEQRGVNLFCFI